MDKSKYVIKHLDIVLDKVDTSSSFNLNSILSENCNVNKKDNSELAKFLKLCDSVEMLGTTYKYFEKIEYANELFSDFKLSESGIKAKELGGHFKYQEYLKKNPLTLYQKIYLIFFICFGLFGIYKVVQPTVSVSEFEKLKNDFDSLKSEFYSNKKWNSKPTLKLLNDTLQTKNLNDLKTD